MLLRLNLASGTDIRDGWINMDVVPRWPSASRGCDIIWDARTDPLPFVDNSVDEVYAGYLLLHLAPHYHARALEEIRRVLKPGAPVRFGEVDMQLVMQRFIATPWDPRLAELIWGEQGDFHGIGLADFDKHCHGFTEHTLRITLLKAGFDIIERSKIHSDDVWYELTLLGRKNNNPFITVTVPTVRVGGLDILFEGLRSQTWRNFELVLVDGLYKQRKDIVASMAEKCHFKVKHVEAVDNPFPVTAYCRYANTSLLWAEGEIVLHLTDYTALAPNSLETHAIHHLGNSRNIGLMGPHKYYELPKVNPAFPGYKNEDTAQYVSDLKAGKLDRVLWSLFEDRGPYSTKPDLETNAGDLKLNFVFGEVVAEMFHAKNESCALEALLEVNGWDEALDGAHGYQDTDIANRMRMNGMRWLVNPKLIADVLNPRHIFPYTERMRTPAENERIYKEKKVTGNSRANHGWDLRELRAKCLAGEPFSMPWTPYKAPEPEAVEEEPKLTEAIALPSV